jgi:NAD(P)-dependent dehydrogenase (short-subunit alcohol dehydrogenase family)
VNNYLVIGAAGGIGRALLPMLAGHNVLACGRTESALRELGVPYRVLDAAQPEAVEAAAREFPHLDGIVNLAGSILLKPAHTLTEAEWQQTITTNLTTAWCTVRAAARTMPQGGSVVLVSTAAARIGLPNHEAIAAAKAGVIGLTLSSAATYAPRGIRVNCVAPGLVETPLSERITKNEAARKQSEAMHALGRIGRPEDVASAIAWLLDSRQNWVTGQVLGVDGGLGSVRSR